jgi:hypothetical protein
MGLDVYLYRYNNKALTEELEKKYETFTKVNWGDRSYDSLSDNEKQDLRQKDKEFAAGLGLDDWGSDKTNKKSIEINSSKYPDHYFKVGYWRSSYNDRGINRVLSNLDLPTLTEIFNPGDEYNFVPDWDLCLVKVKDVIEQLKAKPNLRCFDVSWNDFKNPNECTTTDENEAMKVFLAEKAKHKDGDFEAYSNGNGIFNIKEPLQVFGLVSGVKKMILSDVMLPCTFVICEGNNEWYIQALEIVQETLEYVLAQPDKDKYELHWSS